MFRRHPICISLVVSALMLAVLGAAELAARRYAPAKGIQNFAQYLFESSGPFFEAKIVRGRQELIQVPRHSLFPYEQRFALQKPAGLRRIVVIGESSAVGLGSSIYDAVKRNGLSQRIEIINMAVGAAGLEPTMRLYHEALQYAPDAIVLLFGHNLFNYHPMVALSPYPGVDSLRFLFLKSRLLSLLAEHLSWRKQSYEFRIPGRWIAFRECLSKMADEARRRGVRLALCTVPGNLHFPPLAEDSTRWAPEFLETKYLYLTGQKESAMRKCRLLLSRRPEAWWNFQLGEWLYQAGRYPQARRRLIAARDEDAWRQRASSAVNDLIREVAGQKRLILFDFERLASESAPHGIPGWESFDDDQHVSQSYSKSEAAECRKIWEAPSGPQVRSRPRDVNGSARQPLREILSVALRKIPLDRESTRTAVAYLAQAHLPGFLSGGEESIRALRRTPWETALLLSYVGEAFWNAGQQARAVRLNDEARRLAPEESEFCLQRARFHMASGEKPEAARWLRHALRLRPDQGEARFYLNKLEAEGSA